MHSIFCLSSTLPDPQDPSKPKKTIISTGANFIWFQQQQQQKNPNHHQHQHPIFSQLWTWAVFMMLLLFLPYNMKWQVAMQQAQTTIQPVKCSAHVFIAQGSYLYW